MNLNNKKTTIFYNGLTFLFLLIGIMYIFLADNSMGFARDMVYREYIIQNTILKHINEYFFSFICLIPLSYAFIVNFKNKENSFSNIINIVTFLFLIIFSLFFLDEYIFIWALSTIFAILRLPFFFNYFRDNYR